MHRASCMPGRTVMQSSSPTKAQRESAGELELLGYVGVMARTRRLTEGYGRKPDVDDLGAEDIVKIMSHGYEGLREGIRNGAKRHEDQQIDGIAAEFLYPGFFGLFSFENPELLVACQKNYNDWLHDYTTASSGRLFGLAAIPVQDPEAAVEELQRVLHLGYRGGCIPCTAPAETPYSSDVYEPLWTLAEEAGFPLSMHVGTNAYIPRHLRPSRVGRRDPIADYAATQNTIQRTLSDLICNGVATRHPNLKFVVAEFNAGWIAHWLDRMYQGLQREYRFKKEAFIGEDPHEVWARQFYATIEDDRPAVLTRSLIGVDNLMWGSDYPHVDSTWPCSTQVIDELFEDVPADERNRITRENVERLYGLTN